MKYKINVITSIFVPILFIFSLAILTSPKAEASDEAGEPFEKIEYKTVDRSDILKQFFNKYNSPLVDHVDTFIEVADKYGIDYRILPAISCVESTCAKFYIKETYNPFGWGGGKIDYNSFDESIESVGKGLHKGYISKGLTTVERIAPVYNPPNPVHWALKVRYFMNQIS